MATKTIFSITRVLPFPRVVSVPEGAAHRLIDATFQSHQVGGHMSDSDPDFAPYTLAEITRMKNDYDDDVYRLHYRFDTARADDFLSRLGDKAPQGLAGAYEERAGSVLTMVVPAPSVVEVIEYSDSDEDINVEADRMKSGDLAEPYRDEPETITKTVHPLSHEQYELIIEILKKAPASEALDRAIVLLEMARDENDDESDDESDDDDEGDDDESDDKKDEGGDKKDGPTA